MKFVAGELNRERLENILNHHIEEAVRVRAAVAYCGSDNLKLFEACRLHNKHLVYYGRYDHSIPVAPEVMRWFLDQRTPNLSCRFVPDILHAKIIWFEGEGAYVGSANLTGRGWVSNIEGGVFLTHEEMVDTGMDVQLERFFDFIHARSHPLDQETWEEAKRIHNGRQKVFQADHFAAVEFDKHRRWPQLAGLADVGLNDAIAARRQRFLAEWAQTLQMMRDIGATLLLPENRPDWITDEVPAGVLADQFLHANYYSRVREGNSYPYDVWFGRHAANPASALEEAIRWWREGRYDKTHEENTIYNWAPRIRQLLSRERLSRLSEDEFGELAGMIHAMRDHAIKQSNSALGLPGNHSDAESKNHAFGVMTSRRRSEAGRSPVQTIEYVLYGGSKADLPGRLWDATNDPQWRIPHLGLSSLGEMVGWAMPDDFPPRNARSGKSLRSLGYDVAVYM